MLTKNKDFNFNELYGKFIANSKNGKRLQPNGKKLSDGSITNYTHWLGIAKCDTIKMYI